MVVVVVVVDARESVLARGRVGRVEMGPAGPFVLKLICAATLNWLQQLINVLESWHKKFI